MAEENYRQNYDQTMLDSVQRAMSGYQKSFAGIEEQIRKLNAQNEALLTERGKSTRKVTSKERKQIADELRAVNFQRKAVMERLAVIDNQTKAEKAQIDVQLKELERVIHNLEQEKGSVHDSQALEHIERQIAEAVAETAKLAAKREKAGSSRKRERTEYVKELESLDSKKEKLTKRKKRTRRTTTQADREKIDIQLDANSQKIKDLAEQLSLGLETYYDDMTFAQRRDLKNRLKQIRQTSNTVYDAINRVQGRLTSSLVDVADNIKSGWVKSFEGFAEKAREWVNSMNLAQIADAAKDSSSNIVKNYREMESAFGREFRQNRDLFSDITRQSIIGVLDTGSYAMDAIEGWFTGEAAGIQDLDKRNRILLGETMDSYSDFLSELYRTTMIKDLSSIQDMVPEIRAAERAIGVAFSDMQNIFWRTLDAQETQQDVRADAMLRSLGNLAISFQQQEGLYVDAKSIMSTINEKINDIYALSSKDSKKTKGLIKSVASIEAIQQSLANQGVDQVSAMLKEWSTMSELEIMQDERFKFFTSMTGGMSAEDIRASFDSGDVTGLYSKLQEGIQKITQGNSYITTALAQDSGGLFNNHAQLISFLQASLDSVVDPLKQAEERANEADLNVESLQVQAANALASASQVAEGMLSRVVAPLADKLGYIDMSWADLAKIYMYSQMAWTVGGGLLKGMFKGLKYIPILGPKAAGLLSSIGTGMADKLAHLPGLSSISTWFKTATTAATGASGTVTSAATAGTSTAGAGGAATGGAATAGGMSTLGTIAATGSILVGSAMMINDAFEGAAKSVEWLGEEAGNTASGKVSSALGGALGGSGDGVGNILSNTAKYAAIGAGVGSFIPVIGTAVGAGIGALTGAVTGWLGGEKLTRIIKGSWDFISDTAGAAWDLISGVASSIWEGISDIAGAAWKGVTKLAKASWKAISMTAEVVWTEVKDIASGIWGEIKDTAKGIWTEVKGIAIGVWDGFTETAAGVWSEVKVVAVGIWGEIKGVASSIWEGVQDTAKSIWTGVQDTASSIWTGVQSAASGIWSGVQSTASSIWSVVEISASAIWEGVGDTARNIWTGVKDTASGIWAGVKDVASGIWYSIEAVATGIWTGVKDTASGIWIGVQDTAKGIWSVVEISASSIWSGVKETASGIWGEVKIAASGIWEGVAGTASGIWKGLLSGVDQIGLAGKNILEGTGSFLDGLGEGLGKAVGESVKGALSGIGDIIGNAVGGALTGVGRGVGEALKSTTEGVANGLDTLLHGQQISVTPVDVNALTRSIQNSEHPVEDRLDIIITLAGIIANNTGLKTSGGLVGDVKDIAGSAWDSIVGGWNWLWGDSSEGNTGEEISRSISIDISTNLVPELSKVSSQLSLIQSELTTDFNALMNSDADLTGQVIQSVINLEGLLKEIKNSSAPKEKSSLWSLFGSSDYTIKDIIDAIQTLQTGQEWKVVTNSFRAIHLNTQSIVQQLSKVSGIKLQGYAGGLSEVPETGAALVHQGEAILTEPQANILRSAADGGIDVRSVLSSIPAAPDIVINPVIQPALDSTGDWFDERVFRRFKNELFEEIEGISDHVITLTKEYRVKIADDVRAENDFIRYFKTYGIFGEAIQNADSNALLDKLITGLLGSRGQGLSGGMGGAAGGSGSGGGAGGGSSFAGGGFTGGMMTPPSGGASTAKPIEGSDAQSKIWNFFASKGMSAEGIAGLMGNLQAESGLGAMVAQKAKGGKNKFGQTDAEYTAAIDSGQQNFLDSVGYGLAQWTTADRKKGLLEFAKKRGTSVGDLNTQLEYLWQELNTTYKKSVLDPIMGAKSVQEASNIVLHNFERPKDQSARVEAFRGGKGQDLFNKLAARGGIDMQSGGTRAPGEAVPSSGDWITIAESQLGYKETGKNQTKYGQWFGMNGQPWCAMFVSWCLAQAGVKGIKSAAVSGLLSQAQAQGRFMPKGTYVPGRGDIFLNKSSGQSHTGFVTGASDSSFTTIEGNYSDKVSKTTRSLNDKGLTGFFALTDQGHVDENILNRVPEDDKSIKEGIKATYAVGTPWVPTDQLAMLHEGEMIVPAQFNPLALAQKNQTTDGTEILQTPDVKSTQLLSGLVGIFSGLVSGKSGLDMLGAGIRTVGLGVGADRNLTVTLGGLADTVRDYRNGSLQSTDAISQGIKITSRGLGANTDTVFALGSIADNVGSLYYGSKNSVEAAFDLGQGFYNLSQALKPKTSMQITPPMTSASQATPLAGKLDNSGTPLLSTNNPLTTPSVNPLTGKLDSQSVTTLTPTNLAAYPLAGKLDNTGTTVISNPNPATNPLAGKLDNSVPMPIENVTANKNLNTELARTATQLQTFIQNNTPVSDQQSSKSNMIVDTLKWQVSRLEAKFDQLIGVVSSSMRGNSGGSSMAPRRSLLGSVDRAFAPVQPQGMSAV